MNLADPAAMHPRVASVPYSLYPIVSKFSAEVIPGHRNMSPPRTGAGAGGGGIYSETDFSRSICYQSRSGQPVTALSHGRLKKSIGLWCMITGRVAASCTLE